MIYGVILDSDEDESVQTVYYTLENLKQIFKQ